jgi:hypothetical protein
VSGVPQDRCTLYMHAMAVKNLASCQKTQWEKATSREDKRYHVFLDFVGLSFRHLVRLVAYWETFLDTP